MTIEFEKIEDFPKAESDEFEFKSSQVSVSDGRKKLSVAISGFANSGGGTFIIGLNDDGDADGGWDPTVGRQSLEDWVDNIAKTVEPTPKVKCYLISDATNRGTIDQGKIVIAVRIYPSEVAPHMAPDNKYYIRAGAHTVPARAFMVEALWARRRFNTPALSHLVRLNPINHEIVQLGIVSIVDVVALDVRVSLSGCGDSYKEDEAAFPIEIKLVDKSNPYFFDATFYDSGTEDFPESAEIKILFTDQAGTEYTYASSVGMNKALPPATLAVKGTNPFGSVDPRQMKKSRK